MPCRYSCMAWGSLRVRPWGFRWRRSERHRSLVFWDAGMHEGLRYGRGWSSLSRECSSLLWGVVVRPDSGNGFAGDVRPSDAGRGLRMWSKASEPAITGSPVACSTEAPDGPASSRTAAPPVALPNPGVLSGFSFSLFPSHLVPFPFHLLPLLSPLFVLSLSLPLSFLSPSPPSKEPLMSEMMKCFVMHGSARSA